MTVNMLVALSPTQIIHWLSWLGIRCTVSWVFPRLFNETESKRPFSAAVMTRTEEAGPGCIKIIRQWADKAAQTIRFQSAFNAFGMHLHLAFKRSNSRRMRPRRMKPLGVRRLYVGWVLTATASEAGYCVHLVSLRVSCWQNMEQPPQMLFWAPWCLYVVGAIASEPSKMQSRNLRCVDQN